MFDGIIRPFQTSDLASVTEIFNLYWKDDFGRNLEYKLKRYIKNDPLLLEQDFKIFVAEKQGEVVGVAIIRKAPPYMAKYAQTINPAELYVLAVKHQGQGIGTALTDARINEAKKEGFTEVVLFSGETHQDSWKFHDSHFERVGPGIAPNGEKGYIWRKSL